MKWPLVILLVLPLLASAGPKKKRALGVEVVQLTARRDTQGMIELDGRVRNTSGRPLRDLVLLFDVLAPGQEVLTTQRGPIEPETFPPGEEAEFHWQTRDEARGVHIRVRATDRSGVELNVAGPGPYPIE